MSALYSWAARWGIRAEAIAELQELYGLNGTAGAERNDKTEAYADSLVVLEAARKGVRLWRNNVGACKDERGRLIRYGLANESKQINEKIKSGDRIGIRPVLVTPAHVGTVIGQFVSREIKRPGWHYTGQDREPAQLAWIELVSAMGGDAKFTAGEGSI